jgi:hypothetical protein
MMKATTWAGRTTALISKYVTDFQVIGDLRREVAKAVRARSPKVAGIVAVSPRARTHRAPASDQLARARANASTAGAVTSPTISTISSIDATKITMYAQASTDRPS